MEEVFDRCAGLDVHQKTVVACIVANVSGTKKTMKETQTFGTTTFALTSLKEWLSKEQVEAVVMESTGQYWRPVWNILSDGGRKMILALPQEVKNLRGRKTDKKDAEHIAEVGMHGLVTGSYVPDEEGMEMRFLSRTCENYQSEMTRKKNQIHNILQTGNIKITTYVTDIFGKTGRALINLLMDGEAVTEEKVVQVMRKNLKASPKELVEAMNGKLSRAQRIVLKTLFDSLDEIQRHIDEVDQLINEHLAEHEEMYRRLQEIPGVSEKVASTVLSEIGFTVEAFPTAGHFANWCGVCPGSYESGGIRKSAHITRGNKHLKNAFTQASLVASHSKEDRFKDYYWKIRSKGGAQKAVIAVAHKLLRIIYAMIKTGEHYDPNHAGKEKSPTSRIVPEMRQAR